VVLPNPPIPVSVIRARIFKEFERHSRVGMVSEESFARRVEELRKAGQVRFLKTGAYRPADLARAIVYSSRYGIDLLTSMARWRTGMSPWRMITMGSAAGRAPLTALPVCEAPVGQRRACATVGRRRGFTFEIRS